MKGEKMSRIRIGSTAGFIATGRGRSGNTGVAALLGLILAAFAVLVLQGTASATFPGTNGKIVFEGEGRTISYIRSKRPRLY